ncbi:hypothetical protein GCM10010513_31040 [Streptomyces glebosus]|nr:hypothetical protein GCM10010513_31040 [Streptomyces glebosus]
MNVQRVSHSPGLRAWLGLLVLLGPVLLVAMDGSVLFLAMAKVSEALSPTADQALWILDVYGFAVGSLLIAFGNIGDRYGRLKLLMTGAAVFGAASAGAAFAPGPVLLIAFRALMGVAGATLLPSALAVLSELFTDSRQRAKAIGIFAATFAAGFAIGPIIGGQLLNSFWWGAVFLINLPVVVLFLSGPGPAPRGTCHPGRPHRRPECSALRCGHPADRLRDQARCRGGADSDLDGHRARWHRRPVVVRPAATPP